MDALIWLAAIGTAVAVVAAYFVGFHRRALASSSEAAAAPATKSRGQYPHIDPARCVGCGTCVEVCPEGDVLAVVTGQARVINGARCIGIAMCEEACPVGAIEVGLGEIRGRADLPVLDTSRETTRPGVYIAGELGGLSLIRHAVEQGREVVRAVAARAESLPAAPDGITDIAIVGAGPAGLSAALAAVEAGLSHVILEQEENFGGSIRHYPRRKIVHTQPVEVPLYGTLDRSEQLKEELVTFFADLSRRHRLRLETGRRVVRLEGEQGNFRIVTDRGTYHARFVALCLGRRGSPRKLGVAGEESQKVMYQLQDARAYRGSHVLCVGGGDSALEAAMGLCEQEGARVTLSYRGERIARAKRKNERRFRELVASGALEALFESHVLRIEDEHVVLEQRGELIELRNDYVFVFAGGVPPFPLLKEMGIHFGDDLEEPVAPGP